MDLLEDICNNDIELNVLKTIANIYLKLNNVRDAITYYQRAINITPKNIDYHINIAGLFEI